jgi:hypothetical protein
MPRVPLRLAEVSSMNKWMRSNLRLILLDFSVLLYPAAPSARKTAADNAQVTAESSTVILNKKLQSKCVPTECLSTTEDVMTARVSSDLVQGLATPVNADSLAILHDCKPNRPGVPSASPTTALPLPSLDAAAVSMSVPQRVVSSPSVKLFGRG